MISPLFDHPSPFTTDSLDTVLPGVQVYLLSSLAVTIFEVHAMGGQIKGVVAPTDLVVL